MRVLLARAARACACACACSGSHLVQQLGVGAVGAWSHVDPAVEHAGALVVEDSAKPLTTRAVGGLVSDGDLLVEGLAALAEVQTREVSAGFFAGEADVVDDPAVGSTDVEQVGANRTPRALGNRDAPEMDLCRFDVLDDDMVERRTLAEGDRGPCVRAAMVAVAEACLDDGRGRAFVETSLGDSDQISVMSSSFIKPKDQWPTRRLSPFHGQLNPIFNSFVLDTTKAPNITFFYDMFQNCRSL